MIQACKSLDQPVCCEGRRLWGCRPLSPSDATAALSQPPLEKARG